MIIADCPVEYIIETAIYTDHLNGAGYYDYDLEKNIDYNETNNVISVGLRCNDFTLGFTSFENSYYKQSYMLSLEYNIYSIKDIYLDLGISAINGYDKRYIYNELFINDNILIAPMAAVSYKPELLKFDTVSISPKIRFIGTAVTLNVEFSF